MGKALLVGALALFAACAAVHDPASAEGWPDRAKAHAHRLVAVQPRSAYGDDCGRGGGVDHPWACTPLSAGITGDYSDYY